MGINGTSLADNNLSWGVQESYGTNGQGNGASANADWRATYGELKAAYDYDKNQRRLSYGIQGGVLAHEDVITIGQPLDSTSILIKAPGVNGVSVNNQTGVRTDWRGYALVPTANPFRKNTISLNTETLPNDVDLELTSKTVVPTKGAVVIAEYKANIGRRVILSLSRKDGSPVPFGAIASLNNGEQNSIVGDDGQVYLSGLPDSGILNVKWGKSIDEQCRVDFNLSSDSGSSEYSMRIIDRKCY